MNEDFDDLLRALLDHSARFLLIGAHAMAIHGVPRATGDLDLWIDPEPANAARIWDALVRFGAPIREMGLARGDLETPGIVVQIGLPPRRIDLMTEVTGLSFEEAWRHRETHVVGAREIPVVSRADLVRNKRACGRAKDRADLEALTGEED